MGVREADSWRSSHLYSRRNSGSFEPLASEELGQSLSGQADPTQIRDGSSSGTNWEEKMPIRYELIVYWGSEDQSYIVEVPELDHINIVEFWRIFQ